MKASAHAVRLLAVASVAFSCVLCATADEHPKYYLYTGVTSSAAGGTAFENAKWWKDESGNIGKDGDTPDPAGDFYAVNYRIDTRSAMGISQVFNCNSLHISNEAASQGFYIYNYYNTGTAVFTVLGEVFHQFQNLFVLVFHFCDWEYFLN